jgi:arginyl-tRNA synthetase
MEIIIIAKNELGDQFEVVSHSWEEAKTDLNLLEMKFAKWETAKEFVERKEMEQFMVDEVLEDIKNNL